MTPFDPRLLRHARGAAVHVATCAALGALTAGLVIAQAWLLARTISAAFQAGAGLGAQRRELALLAAVLAARAGVAWLQESAAHRASASVKSDLRQAVLARAVAAGPAALAAERSGAIAGLVTRGLDALDGYFAKYLPQLVLAVLVPVAVLAVMLPADLLAGVTVIVTLPLIPLFMVLIGKATEASSRRRFRALAVLGHHFLDVVQGLPTLTVFGRARAQTESIRAVSDRYRVETMATLRVAFLSSLVLELLATLSVALVAVGVGLRLVSGGLDLRTGLFVLILAPEAYLPLRQVGVHFHASADGLAAADEAFRLIELPDAVPAGSRPVPRWSTLRVRQVTVRHDGRSDPAPDAVTLDVRRGETVCLAGPSGSGKSTLLHVLLRLRRADAGGVVLLDPDGSGTPLDDVDAARWRGRCAWVAHEPVLLPGTVPDNIRFGRAAADAAVADAAQAAGLRADDPTLAAGLATAVGERGSALSAGQRRRVGVARALLGRPDLLLLDEPTAGLDPQTEADVLAAVRAAAADGAAVLVVGHRPAVLAAADRVVHVAAPSPAAGGASALPADDGLGAALVPG